MPPNKPSVDDILKKYGSKIESKIQTSSLNKDYSREYQKFKAEMSSELSTYERFCKSLGNSFKVKVPLKTETQLLRQIKIAHMDVTPQESYSLSVMSSLGLFFTTFLISVALLLINNGFPFMFFILMSGVSLFLFYFLNSYPERIANQWRLKASSQMVPAILYVVVYMRHTPNLEKAIAFASEHLDYPLALDFRKIFYDVEISKFSTLKESLDHYLETWRDYSFEFIEAFHLIESSLFEPDEERRISTLEKSLQVVLDGVYDKMLKFTHDVRSPLTNIYMLTVVLPVLGIALLPLASVLVGGFLKWYHIFILYTMILPFTTLYLTDKIMLLRPGGYGETSFLEKNPLYPKYKSNDVFLTAAAIAFPIILIGLLPLIFQYTSLPALLGIGKDFTFSEIGLGFFSNQKFFGFIETSLGFTGPFGIGALLLGLLVPFGVALFFIIAYNEKTRELIIERNNTKQLENEFNNSLFQLGNRLGNGMPPEIAFGKVAESSSGLVTENFFKTVNYNIRQNGMGVERAIFDQNRGAIIQYPSALIATSMRILIESSKKGLKIAALSLMSISQYIKNIQKITQRLRDMLAEIISDMRSNITFLAPLLLGIVIGLAAMITAILNILNASGLGEGGAQLSGFSSLLSIFDLTSMISPYYLQIIIGIYLIEMIFILTRTLVTIDSGEDELQNTNQIGKNLKSGVYFYIITAFISITTLFALSSIVVGGFG